MFLHLAHLHPAKVRHKANMQNIMQSLEGPSIQAAEAPRSFRFRPSAIQTATRIEITPHYTNDLYFWQLLRVETPVARFSHVPWVVGYVPFYQTPNSITTFNPVSDTQPSILAAHPYLIEARTVTVKFDMGDSLEWIETLLKNPLLNSDEA